jgi:hypothetical protein
MNFTRFVKTDSSLAPGTTQELMHRLMFSQAALQPCPAQKHWDLLIPVYLGEPFDRGKATAMLIQVKNSERKNAFIVERGNYQRLFRLVNPVITVLLELGGKDPGIEMVESFSNKVFAFAFAGAGQAT